MPPLRGRKSHNGSRSEQVNCSERESNLPGLQEGVGHQPMGRPARSSTTSFISSPTAHSPCPATTCSATAIIPAAAAGATCSATAIIPAAAAGATCTAAAIIPATAAGATCSAAAIIPATAAGAACSAAAIVPAAAAGAAATARSATARQAHASTCCPCLPPAGTTTSIGRPPALNVIRTDIRPEEGRQHHRA